MSIIVEHEKRRKDILKRALGVFMAEGFENATFQKIADSCGITRTTLYIYFKNKKEIFNYSIKQMLVNAEENLQAIQADKTLNSVEKLTKVMLDILKLLEQNRSLLLVILDYLMHPPADDSGAEVRVRRRTLRLRHILASMVIEGIKAGELKKVNIKTVDDLLYSFIESGILHLTVLKHKTTGDLRDAVVFAVKQLRSPAPAGKD